MLVIMGQAEGLSGFAVATPKDFSDENGQGLLALRADSLLMQEFYRRFCIMLSNSFVVVTLSSLYAMLPFLSIMTVESKERISY